MRQRVEGVDIILTAEVENLAQQMEAVDPNVDTRTRTLAFIVVRQGQPAFRQALLRAYDERCAVTGVGLTSLLEAAHIMPPKEEETNRVNNGLLLRADINTLFDLGLLTVVTEGQTHRVRCAPALSESDYATLDGRPLIVVPEGTAERPHEENLRRHNLDTCDA